MGKPGSIVTHRRAVWRLARAPLLALLWVGAGGICRSQRAGGQEADGFDALRAGRYDEAARSLRGLALDGDAAARSGWVTALRETGDYAGAVSGPNVGWNAGPGGARCWEPR